MLFVDMPYAARARALPRFAARCYAHITRVRRRIARHHQETGDTIHVVNEHNNNNR